MSQWPSACFFLEVTTEGRGIETKMVWSWWAGCLWSSSSWSVNQSTESSVARVFTFIFEERGLLYLLFFFLAKKTDFSFQASFFFPLLFHTMALSAVCKTNEWRSRARVWIYRQKCRFSPRSAVLALLAADLILAWREKKKKEKKYRLSL